MLTKEQIDSTLEDAILALAFLAHNPRPIGGESSYNSLHLEMLCQELRAVEKAISALIPAAFAGRQQIAECARIAAKIHYPEHWDTAAYPTVDDALLEIVGNFECSECHPAIASPEGDVRR